MKSPHILLAGTNIRQVKNNLGHVIDAVAAQAIEDEISRNVTQLFTLGLHHYSFAQRLAVRNWRQTISRAYYGAYNVSRAVRLHVSGDFSMDIRDHQKIESLPSDFPMKSTYTNRLVVLREDRNLCDYDHTAGEADLVIGRKESLELVSKFIADARRYLKGRGVNL